MQFCRKIDKNVAGKACFVRFGVDYYLKVLVI